MTNISVLIPVYNAEKTIKRTLDSLSDQTMVDFEVVIVNDGSVDGTYDILEYYKNKFKNINIIHQKNMGIAAARQLLIENATGEYILFCDADDYVEKSLIEDISNTIEQANSDLILFGYQLVRKNVHKIVLKRKLPEGIYDNRVTWERMHIAGLTDLYWSALWNKCYKKKLIERLPQIRFQNLLEDVIFNVEYIERCESIFILEKNLYNYVQIGDSLTRGEKTDSEKDIKEAFDSFCYLRKRIEKTYPDTVDAIESNRYFYSMLKSISERAKKIGKKDLALVITQSDFYRKTKKNLGYKCYEVEINRIIRSLKKKMKMIMKQ